MGNTVQTTAAAEPTEAEQSVYLKELQAEESMASLLEGQSHFFSTQPQELTESDAEYVIACVKHVFTKNVILQYQIANSIED